MHLGLLLAGGRSRRMGGANKLLVEVGGARLLDRAIIRLRPQVEHMLVSANGNADELSRSDLPVVEDGPFAGRGPLAGLLAGLRWGEATGDDEALVISVPCDTPFLPLDLVARLVAARTADTRIAVAASEKRLHYAVAAWPVALADDLEAWLRSGKGSAIREFLSSMSYVTVPFAAPFDPFFNVNTPHDLQRAIAIETAFEP